MEYKTTTLDYSHFQDYNVRLFPLSVVREQEILGAKLLRDSQRFLSLENKKTNESLTEDEVKEHQKLLAEWIRETPKLNVRKLEAQIKGKDADDLISLAKSFGVEESLLTAVDKRIELDIEDKKKSQIA